MNVWIAAVLAVMVSMPVHAATEIAPHVEQITFKKAPTPSGSPIPSKARSPRSTV